MKTLLIWGHKERPWPPPRGYEVRVDLQDDSEQIFCEVLSFPLKEKGEPPDKEEVAKAIDIRIARIQAAQEAQAEEARQAPIRKALEIKAEFLAEVSAGRIKKDEMVIELGKISDAGGKG